MSYSSSSSIVTILIDFLRTNKHAFAQNLIGDQPDPAKLYLNVDKSFLDFVHPSSVLTRLWEDKCFTSPLLITALALSWALGQKDAQSLKDILQNISKDHLKHCEGLMATHPNTNQIMVMGVLVAYSENMARRVFFNVGQTGDREVLKHLRKFPQATLECWSFAAKGAAKKGHVKFLEEIHATCPQALTGETLQVAARAGQTACVNFLLPLASPKFSNSYALRSACQKNHTQIALILIPLSDTKAERSEACFFAALNDNPILVEALEPLSNMEHVYARLKRSGQTKKIEQMRDRKKAQEQADRLMENLEESPVRRQRKM